MTSKEKLRLSAQGRDMVCINKRLEVFPFDEVFYEKGKECRTCKIEKLARSKHCSVCDVCYDYFDHHCVWINACVTRSNLKAFIFFVFSHAVLTLYGGIVFVLALVGEVSKVNDIKFGQFFDVQTGFYAIYQYAWDFSSELYRFGRKNWLLTGLGSTCFTLGLTLPFFCMYHISLVLKNRTTNEEMKVKKLKFGLNNQHIFFRAIIGKTKKLQQAFEEEQQKKEEAAASGADTTEKKETADTEPKKADEIIYSTIETKYGAKQEKNGQQEPKGKKAVVQLPRFKLDGVEIPQDPDERIEFFEKKAEGVLEKMEILTGEASPYKRRSLKEAWYFLSA